jgi:hypothetical protein
MCYIYEYLKHHFQNNIRNGNFYDLGSGTGKGVIAMSLLHPFRKCIGIEFLENLTLLSKQNKEKYDKEIDKYISSKPELFPEFKKKNEIEFINSDFLKQSWTDTSVMFANSTCFNVDLMKNIATKANKECQSGTIIVTLTKKLNNLNTNWEIHEGFRRLMTWGIATIYVHRKK